MSNKAWKELLSPEYQQKVNEAWDKDWTLKKLTRNRQHWKEKRRGDRVAQTDIQIEARQTEIVDAIIAEYMTQRDIRREFVNDLPEDRRLKYISLRNAMSFCCDTLETIINDINSCFKGTGLKAELDLPSSIKDARTTVRKWIAEDMTTFTQAEQDLYCEEADKAAEYLIERGRVLETKRKRLKPQKGE